MPCRNVGGIDRALRLAVGSLLLPIGLALHHGHGWTIAIVGAFVLASAILGFCPPYALLGISTARAKEPQVKAAPAKPIARG